MAIYWQFGGELEDAVPFTSITQFTQTGSSPVTDLRGSTNLSLGGGEDTNYIESDAFSSGEFWTGFRAILSSGFLISSINMLKWYNSGTHRLAIDFADANGTRLRLKKWNGATWDVLGTSDYVIDPFTLTRFDVYIKLGNPGGFRLYMNNVPIIALAGIDLSFVATIDKLRIQQSGSTGNYALRLQEVIIADFNTIGSRVRVKTPDTNGNYLEWTAAAFGLIDEVTVSSDFVTSGTVNQRFTFLSTDFSALASGESLENVRLSWRANRDAGGPQNINAMTRISSTDYHSGDQALAVAMAGGHQDWAVSPATSAAWTISEVNAAEFGLRSRT